MANEASVAMATVCDQIVNDRRFREGVFVSGMPRIAVSASMTPFGAIDILLTRMPHAADVETLVWYFHSYLTAPIRRQGKHEMQRNGSQWRIIKKVEDTDITAFILSPMEKGNSWVLNIMKLHGADNILPEYLRRLQEHDLVG